MKFFLLNILLICCFLVSVKFFDFIYDISLDRTTFAESRPKHMVVKSSTVHHMCVCIYHKNVDVVEYSIQTYQWITMFKFIFIHISSSL